MASINDPEPPEYLEDPEAKLTEWSDDIWASTETEARQKCRDIGIKERCRLMSMRSLNRKRWRCTFRSYE
ncbi:MAG: hypothetical protein J7647_09325 [Cyanobacteria bacterium SBLK]|nr:hypothetical protein [Cyanobacteria bacterium SBLK]